MVIGGRLGSARTSRGVSDELGDASRYTYLMRKISGNLFMAIDGVVESPEKWSLSYWNDDIANVVMGGMQGAGALLLGRVSTRDSPRPGPTIRSEDDPGAGFMPT